MYKTIHLCITFLITHLLKSRGRKNMLKKGIAIGVILLFIGVAFSPSITAFVVDYELVEFAYPHTEVLFQEKTTNKK